MWGASVLCLRRCRPDLTEPSVASLGCFSDGRDFHFPAGVVLLPSPRLRGGETWGSSPGLRAWPGLCLSSWAGEQNLLGCKSQARLPHLAFISNRAGVCGLHLSI